jgi:DNA-binding response OmpR family regulator
MRVLLVEDEDLIAAFIATALEREGLTVDRVCDGEAAVAAGVRHVYDLIILDILLPRKDGLAVCREIRAVDSTTPILMLTARGDLEDKVLGLDAGADDYLTKPFAVEELLARVRSLLRRSALLRPPPLAAYDLTLDTESYEVTRAGERIALTGTEFRLLEHLLRHLGQVCGRRELLMAVWGYEFDPGTNLVDVFIRRLRRKLERPGAPPLLHTVRGVGYRLGE